MNRIGRAAASSAVALAFILTACRSPAVRQQEPAPDPPEITQEAPARNYAPADVLFMQQMIPHHRQALEMTALVTDRTDNRDIHLIAQRIEVSQNDEIAMMQQWLKSHGEDVEHHHGGHLMPGMLTPEEMSRLENARGGEFDRLFLEFMISHHEGALTMVGELFAAPGAAENSVIFRFASDVDADQRAEIRRMQSLLAATAN